MSQQHREACQKYRQNHKEKVRVCQKQWRLNHPDKVKEQSRKSNEQRPHRENGNSQRTPKQWRAQGFIQRHPNLRGNACEICDAKDGLIVHHPDYEFPQIIVTVCTSCHNWIHKGVT